MFPCLAQAFWTKTVLASQAPSGAIPSENAGAKASSVANLPPGSFTQCPAVKRVLLFLDSTTLAEHVYAPTPGITPATLPFVVSGKTVGLRTAFEEKVWKPRR